MKKLVGYGISVVGLIFMTLGFGIIPISIEFLEGVSGSYIAGVGVILIVVGVILSLKSEGRGRKIKNVDEEVPIYEGTGKKRKIVGYRKD